MYFHPGIQTIEKYSEDWTFIIQEDGKPRTASRAGPGIFVQCPGHLTIETLKKPKKQGSNLHTIATYKIFTIRVCV